MITMVLDKLSILKGVEKVETVHIESLGGEVKIRPLTSEEWIQISMEEQKGLGEVEVNVGSLRQTDGTLKINLQKQAEASFNAKVKAVSLALSCDGEEWEPGEVKQLLPGVIDEIYAKVMDVSGVNVEESELDQFHPER